MGKYIIDYDLREEDADYEKLIEGIKILGEAAQIAKSSWCLLSNRNCTDIRDYLETKIDGDNRLFVGEVTGTASWHSIIESERVKHLLEK